MLTRKQMIEDCGTEENARKYADGARELLDAWVAGDASAPEAWAAMRWELGEGTSGFGVHIEDPFLTDDDRDRIRKLKSAALES